MTENIHPFKLERESTLMPAEFRERLSASHKSRKSSAAKTIKTRSRQHTATLRYSTENSNISTIHQNTDNMTGPNRGMSDSCPSTYNARAEYDKVIETRNEALAQNRNSEDVFDETGGDDEEFRGDRTYTLDKSDIQHLLHNMNNMHSDMEGEDHKDENGNHTYRKENHVNTSHGESVRSGSESLRGGSVELQSTSAHIELTGEVKFMFDSAYQNMEQAASFGARTPPKHMQIKDLVRSLDDWGSNDTIQEKKYAVLPSIHRNSQPENYSSGRHSTGNSSNVSINNQLDFYRDKIEEDADFFADFRVNTSTVKPTPRQDPLPPIKNGDLAVPAVKTKRTGHKKKHRDKSFVV